MYWYRYDGFFPYINSLWKHSINVPRLIWSSVGMKVKSLENMLSYANWRVIFTSSRYDWNIRKKIKRPRKWSTCIRYTYAGDGRKNCFQYFKQTITLHYDVRPGVERRCLHAHDTHAPLIHRWYWIAEKGNKHVLLHGRTKVIVTSY